MSIARKRGRPRKDGSTSMDNGQRQDTVATDGVGAMVGDVEKDLDVYNSLVKTIEGINNDINDILTDEEIPKARRRKLVLDYMSEARKTMETIHKIFEIRAEEKKRETVLTKLIIEVIDERGEFSGTSDTINS